MSTSWRATFLFLHFWSFPVAPACSVLTAGCAWAVALLSLTLISAGFRPRRSSCISTGGSSTGAGEGHLPVLCGVALWRRPMIHHAYLSVVTGSYYCLVSSCLDVSQVRLEQHK